MLQVTVSITPINGIEPQGKLWIQYKEPPNPYSYGRGIKPETQTFTVRLSSTITFLYAYGFWNTAGLTNKK